MNKKEYVDLLVTRIEDSNKNITTIYIHCSKLHTLFQKLLMAKDILNKIFWVETKTISNDEVTLIDDIIDIISQIKELAIHCCQENCVQYLLNHHLSEQRELFFGFFNNLKEKFNLLGIKEVAVLFNITGMDLDKYDEVDLKRIKDILNIAEKKGRKDLKSCIEKRYSSLEELGVPMNQIVEEELKIPELQDNINLIVDRADYEFNKKIGTGQSGEVYLARNKKTGALAAVKVLKRTTIPKIQLDAILREVSILKALNHKNLLKAVGYTNSSPYWILTEYMSNGSLFNAFQHKKSELTPTRRSLIAYDIANGLSYLHLFGFIHRDMKSLNILLDENFRAKICDFGMTRSIDQSSPMTGMIGSSHWMAPEVLLSKPNYNEKADVYSFGIILYELLTLKQPFGNLSPAEISRLVAKKGNTLELPEDTPRGLKRLISDCLKYDSRSRPSMERVITFLQNEDCHFLGTDHEEFMREAGIQKRKNTLSIPDRKKKELLYDLDDEKSIDDALKDLCNASETDITPVIIKKLLEFSSNKNSKRCQMALKALIRAINLKFESFKNDSTCLISLLMFVRTEQSCETFLGLYDLADRLINTMDTLHERVFDIIVWSLNKDESVISGPIKCFISLLRFKEVYSRIDRQLFTEIVREKKLNPIVIEIAKKDELSYLDQKLITILNDVRNPELYCRVACYHRFSCLLPVKDNDYAIDIFMCLNDSMKIIENIELYDNLAQLIEKNVKSCQRIFRNFHATEAVEKSSIVRRLTKSVKKKEPESLVPYLSIIYSISKSYIPSGFRKLVKPLRGLLSGQVANLELPSFLCLCVLSRKFSDKMDFSTLLPLAACYVCSDNEMVSEEAVYIIENFCTHESVDLSKTISVFTENYSSKNEHIKRAVRTFGEAFKKNPIDDGLRVKMSAIYNEVFCCL